MASKFRPSTAYKPGQSGNPGGRAKLTATAREARRLLQDMSPEGVKLLMGCIDDLQAAWAAADKCSDMVAVVKVKRAIAAEIFDRGLGKPAQQIDLTAGERTADEVQAADRAQQLQFFREAIALLEAEEAMAKGQVQ